MIPGSKVILHDALAQEWRNDRCWGIVGFREYVYIL